MGGGSNASRSTRRLVVSLALRAVIVLVAAVAIALLRRPSRPVDTAARHPIWTASILGSAGDLAEIWVWTPKSTLRTNLPLPVTLRFDEKNLLVQVRSQQNRDIVLVVLGRDGSGAHTRLAAGSSNSAHFACFARIPFLSVERHAALPWLRIDTPGYCGVNPPSVPLGIRPVFNQFPFLRPSGFDVVPNAVTRP